VSRTDTSRSDGPREITVPLRVYKAITVFSTLFAIVFVIAGFGFLDAATAAVGPFAVVFDLLGLPGADGGAFSLVLALLGLALIGFGAGIYVLGTRFRTPGMGNSQDDGDESLTNE
jgi:hypothetical protein